MATYSYLGGQVLSYPGYRDLAADRMLIAEPEGEYDMAPVDAGLPVPPNDGRWVLASGDPVPEPEPDPVLAAPEPDPAPDPAPAPEGGE